MQHPIYLIIKHQDQDGLPGEIYKKYEDILLPELLDVITSWRWVHYPPPPSINEAVIIVLLKPDKDPSNPDSYRPISLLTSDIKLLAKASVTRLSRLILCDQSGFIPNRSTANNIQQLFLNLQLPTDNMGNRAIMSLDAAKALDSIDWAFLWKCLKHYGFGPRFIKWILCNFCMTPQVQGYRGIVVYRPLSHCGEGRGRDGHRTTCGGYPLLYK